MKMMIVFCILFLTACTMTKKPTVDPKQNYLQHNYPRAFNALFKKNENNTHDPASLYALGYFYYYGLGNNKDQDIARTWIQKAAAQNYLPAVLALNEMTKVRVPQ